VRTVPQVNLNVGNLFLQTVATGEERLLTSYDITKGEGVIGRPAWSPDRTQLAVTYTRDDLKTSNVRIVNVADGSGFDLTADGRSGSPTWTATRPLDSLPNNLTLQPRIPLPEFTPGDIDASGVVDVADAVLGLRIIVGLADRTEERVRRGDMNGDTQLDVGDVVLILQRIVGSG
jgi:hypothetical protein